MAQKLICIKSLTPEVPSEDATKMCVIHYDFQSSFILKSLHFILAQSGNSIIATAYPLKSS